MDSAGEVPLQLATTNSPANAARKSTICAKRADAEFDSQCSDDFFGQRTGDRYGAGYGDSHKTIGEHGKPLGGRIWWLGSGLDQPVSGGGRFLVPSVRGSHQSSIWRIR
jgi:hypothetical protein